MISRRFLMWSVCRNIYHKLEFSPVYKWGSEVEILRLGAISETNRWAACISVLAIAFSDYAIINWGTARRHHLDCFTSQILSRITTWHKTPLDVLLARPHHPDQSIYTMLVPIFAKKKCIFSMGGAKSRKRGHFSCMKSRNFEGEVMRNTTYREKCLQFETVILTFTRKGSLSHITTKKSIVLKREKGLGGGGS